METLFNYLRSLPRSIFIGGYVISILLIGTGIYDIATLDRTATGSETAPVWGKTLGSTGGALIGTQIIPGIGTAFGAFLGYFVCGEVVKSTDYFDDDLDKARKALKESTEELEETKARQEKEYLEEKQEYIDFIHKEFLKLSNNSSTLSKDNLEKFKMLMITNGFVKEDVWNNSIESGASHTDMLSLSKQGAIAKVDAVKKAREDWVLQELRKEGYIE